MGDRICVMKAGIIQQFDTPQELYNNPDNMFVAGFIGSPQMNFLPAMVEKAGDGYMLSAGNCKVPVSRPGLADYVGKEVIMGIRPEDFHIEPAMLEKAGTAVIEARIDLDEMMGSEIYLYFEYEGQKMISRIPSKYAIKADETARLALDLDKIHIFDKDTEKAIR